MRYWIRRPVQVRCGYCGALVPKNTPVLFIESARERAVNHRFIRCEKCAGEAVPDEVSRTEPPRLTVPIRLGNVVAFDVKAAQVARERPESA